MSLLSISETYNERVKRLLVHSYDDRIEQYRINRSMENTKLIDLKEESLHLTEDYINAVRHLLNISEIKTYMKI